MVEVEGILENLPRFSERGIRQIQAGANKEQPLRGET